MSILTNLTATAKADLAKLGAEAQTYVSALEAKVASNLPISIGCGLAGMVVGAGVMWLKSKL